MMFQDIHLIFALFGFVFLMLLFRVPFAAGTIKTGVFRVTHSMRISHLRTLVDRHPIHGRSPMNV